MIFLLFSASAQAQMCIDLFSNGPKVLNLEEYSRRRFQKPVEKMKGSSEVLKFWQAHVGTPIFPFRNLIRVNRVTHESIFLSPKEGLVISIGSDKQLRLITPDGSKILKTIKIESIVEDYRGEVIEVLSLTDTHFVLGLEPASRRSRSQSMGLLMFRPETLLMFDLQGNQVGAFYSDFVIKGNIYIPEQKSWIVADQDTIELIHIPAGKVPGNYYTFSPIIHKFLTMDHHVSALSQSPDGNTLFIAMSSAKHKAKVSEIISVDIKDVNHPIVLDTKTVELAQIYSLDLKSDGSLEVTGSRQDADSNEPAVTIYVH